LVPPSRLGQGSYYHVFRSGIRPEWEDARNEAGGKWVISVQHQMQGRLNELWLNTVMAIIGENFAEYNEHICGAVVSVRGHKVYLHACTRHTPSERSLQQDRLSLWTKTSSDEKACIEIGKRWKSILNLGDSFRITYQAHKESMKSKASYRGSSLYEC
jgi:translation initiation factor 4E